jgi:hypothetical protein
MKDKITEFIKQNFPDANYVNINSTNNNIEITIKYGDENKKGEIGFGN